MFVWLKLLFDLFLLKPGNKRAFKTALVHMLMGDNNMGEHVKHQTRGSIRDWGQRDKED